MCRWLVGDAYLKARRTPVDEPDGTAGLQLGNSGGDVLRYHVSTVQQCTCHCDVSLRDKPSKHFLGWNILYFPSMGSQLIIWLPRWKQALVIALTSFISCWARSTGTMGDKVARGKCIRGNLIAMVVLEDPASKDDKG